MKYQLIDDNEGFGSITVYLDGETYFATRASHENFDRIVEMVRNDDLNVIDLFDLTRGIPRYSDRNLSGRVTLQGGTVYFDGEPMDNSLSDLMMRFIDSGDDPTGLVKFLENLDENPNPHSRKMLFDWLNTHRFSITEGGKIVGYKGVRDDFSSITAGPGYVNGQKFNGHLDNTPGNVLSIDRSKVTFDPRVGCSAGLHVGTWGYARDFGPVVLEVHVHPKDVVSVPTDCESQKMRVAEYTVVRVVTKPYEKVLVLAGATA
jgi:hypothetical protein